MTTASGVYGFVFRGLLTEEALDRAGRKSGVAVADAALAEALNYPLLDPDLLERATTMGIVYAAIATFESSARLFITRVLLDANGDDWWNTQVSEKIRKFAQSRRDDEEKTKWHGKRGDSLLNYTEMGHLVDIMRQNWTAFEAHVPRIEWAESIFDTIERSRNVIMHSGVLEIEDIERVGINIRDWTKQVGA
ncbi:MAG: Swt1 family HEPN domain-containing protein [Chloroflexota bacterium]|nr:Swt1 family HEPN domain-containing protein [Chloroflexota bacterium]